MPRYLVKVTAYSWFDAEIEAESLEEASRQANAMLGGEIYECMVGGTLNDTCSIESIREEDPNGNRH
jgi:hypothetical protein